MAAAWTVCPKAAIVTATPDHVHVSVILAALEAGLDVYTEKPMTLTCDSALPCVCSA